MNSPVVKRCTCGWPIDAFGECSSCRVRKIEKLPAHAKCETCKDWKIGRCERMGPNSVCRVWKEKPADSVPFVDVQHETAYGRTVSLSRVIRVF